MRAASTLPPVCNPRKTHKALHCRTICFKTCTTSFSMADVYLANDIDKIGHIYDKGEYVLHSCPDFNCPVAKDPWMGLLGPTLYGEIGDSLVIHFKNNYPHAPYGLSMHPHGVLYKKMHEGKSVKTALYMRHYITI